jgi:8-oxo-dGTP diphosphatase
VILPIGDGILLTYQNGEEREFQLTGWIINAPRRLGAYKRFVFMPEYDLWAEKICTIYVARPCYKLCDPLEKDHSGHILSVPLALQVMPNEADRDYIKTFFGL